MPSRRPGLRLSPGRLLGGSPVPLSSAPTLWHPLHRLLGDLWRRLSHSRKKLLDIFHIILYHICLLPVLESG